MIKSCQIVNNFPTVLPDVGTKKFEFGDGLQILFGPNGCGKSTLLKTIKAYCGIEKGGWSSISAPEKLGVKSARQFPFAYRQYTPNHCDAKVEWDGLASFYNDGDIKIDTFGWFVANQETSEDGITSDAEAMELMTRKPSSGQYRAHKISKILSVIKNPPDLAAGGGVESQYIRALPRNGKHTLLFDEPERALALPKQKELFDKVLVPLSKQYQVIVATHSPFVLFNEDARIIDMRAGYANECIEIFKQCFEQMQ